ncbi:MAG: nucleoside recognition domain-containing protein [Anaerotignum sp.]
MAHVRLYPVGDRMPQCVGVWGSPVWLESLLMDGVFLTVSWVVSVMLPPMAIFFPMFTLLEDCGLLPRIAFQLDGLFRRAGAHGKQALTLCMGFGCNAAGLRHAASLILPEKGSLPY